MSTQSLLMALGFAGGIAVLVSYAGSATGRLDAQGAVSHALNAFGAVALVGAGYAVGAWPSVAVNAIWAGIGLAGLRTVLRARRPAGPVVFEPPTAELRVVAEAPRERRQADPPTAELATVC